MQTRAHEAQVSGNERECKRLQGHDDAGMEVCKGMSGIVIMFNENVLVAMKAHAY